MKIKTSYLVLETNKPIKENASKLRGYFGSKFNDYPILHHHIPNSGFLYTYPLVQYKIMGGNASILGIEEGSTVLKEISDQINELMLGKNQYDVETRIIYDKKYDIKPSKQINYRFITPWIGLNSQNYQKYQTINDWKEKKNLLNNILVGNILSMCKGLGIIVNRKLYAHSLFDAEIVDFKGLKVLGFTGRFKVNFKIPDFFGLGKGVSQGFGTVKEAEDVNISDL
jgi:hypothetical protein